MEVRIQVGDITQLEVEAVVNPANSEGEMGGGLAYALKRKGGKKIEEEAMQQAPIAIGQAVLTTGGKLKCRFVIHAPTMVVPAQRTSVEKIQQALRAALELAREHEIRSVAIPGMGTGTGRVPKEEAAKAMVAVIREFNSPTLPIQEVILVDKNEALVEAWKRAWEQPSN